MDRIKEILKRKAEINEILKDEKRSKDVDLKALEKEVRELNEELEELQTRQRLLEETEQINSGQGEVRTIETFSAEGGEKETRNETGTDSLEYRQAFMDFVLRGEKSGILETRAAGTTMTTDIGTVIPQTIINRIIEKMRSHGMIYSRITHTNIKGGVSIPISNVKPTATWTDEGTVSPKQKKTTGEITFSYHKLQCRVAVTLEADTVSLEVFESTLIENIYEAMVVALEEAIISGTGVKQPLGIVRDSRVTNKATLLEDDLKKYDRWAETLSKLPLSAEGKVALIMTKVDFDKYLLGMVDEVGQPVARVTYGLNGKIERRFIGHEVIAVEEYLPTFTGAEDEEVFAFFADLKDYMINSNLAFRYKKYFDEDTDEWIHKTTLIADGKVADPQNILLLEKAPQV